MTINFLEECIYAIICFVVAYTPDGQRSHNGFKYKGVEK